ncbi:hypothetical protein F4810DRAFT_706601 [Camillea tinctor]|nr:hypothetical protein F4810DRAFT_706601 [Camillea tinctor]
MSHPTQIENPEPVQALKTLIFGSGRVALTLRDKKKTTYLDLNDLALLKVQCTEIDFDSGTLKDEGYKSAIPALGEYICSNWHTARFLGDFYLGWLEPIPEEDMSTVNDPDPSNQSLLQLSPWEVLKGVHCQNLDSRGIYWRTVFCLKHYGNSGPHFMCFLANEHPLKGDQLLLSEIFCIIRMTLFNMKKGESHNYQIAPVTVVSVSGQHVRIVQGYGDSSKDCIVVRKSRIISLHENDELNSEGFIRIACWLLGDPCIKSWPDYND